MNNDRTEVIQFDKVRKDMQQIFQQQVNYGQLDQELAELFNEELLKSLGRFAIPPQDFHRPAKEDY